MSHRALLIFDFDGTIADTAAVVMEVGNEVLREYGMDEVEESRLEELKAKSITELRREFKIPVRRIPAIVTSIRKSLKKHIRTIEPIDGMIELIQELEAIEDVELAVLTSNSLENVEYFLKKYKIHKCFKYVIGDIGIFSKYTKLRKLTRSEGKGALVVGVGDEVRDVEAAKIARVHAVSVDWGLNAHHKLKNAKADHVVSDVDSLRKVLLQLVSDRNK